MKRKNITLILLLGLLLPLTTIAQPDKVAVGNLSYDYDSTEGIMRNVSFDILYNGTVPRQGFVMFINLFRLDNGKGPYVPGTGQGFGGTGGGSDKRSINLENPVNLNDSDTLCNGKYRITIFIPEYRELVYEFDGNEDRVVNYKAGSECQKDQDNSTATVWGTSKQKEKVTIYPNPISNGQSINISTANHINANKIEIYSNTGKLIKQLNYSQAELRVNPDAFSPGIYTIRIQHNKGVVTKRLAVTKSSE